MMTPNLTKQKFLFISNLKMKTFYIFFIFIISTLTNMQTNL